MWLRVIYLTQGLLAAFLLIFDQLIQVSGICRFWYGRDVFGWTFVFSGRDITPKSAKIAVVTAFQSNCLQDLSLKAHIIPLAKKLGIKHCSKGKHELMVPIAKELFVQGYLDEYAEINFKMLQRNKLKVCKSLFEEEQPSSLDSSEDSVDPDGQWTYYIYTVVLIMKKTL